MFLEKIGKKLAVLFVFYIRDGIMQVLFKNMHTILILSGFWFIFSSCSRTYNQSAPEIDSLQDLDDTNARAIFKIERRKKSDLTDPYSLEDRIMFVSRQNQNQPYDKIQATQVDGDCYGRNFGNSFKISKAMSTNTFPFHAVLSLEDLQFYPDALSSSLAIYTEQLKYMSHQVYQCNFSFTGITETGSTKSVQNIKVEIPVSPRGGIVIHHRNDQQRKGLIDKFELTESDFKHYNITVLNPIPNIQMTLKCSDFQETFFFDPVTNSQRNLSSLFQLQKYYSLLMANPLQMCHITYGNVGDPYWSWSKPFQILFKEAFADMFDLKFDLKIVDHALDQNDGSLQIHLGTLQMTNPFSKPIFIYLNKDHNNYVKSYIYSLQDSYHIQNIESSSIKKEDHNISFHFVEQSDTKSHNNSQNNNALDFLGGINYALQIEPQSSIKRRVIIKTVGEVNHYAYTILGFEVIKAKNQGKQNFLKLYFGNNRGYSSSPIFDEFKGESLMSICASRFCHKVLRIMLYNNKIRTGH